MPIPLNSHLECVSASYPWLRLSCETSRGIHCLLLKGSPDMVSPSSLATRLRFLRVMCPVWSSSKRLNTLLMSSLVSLSLILAVIMLRNSSKSIEPEPSCAPPPHKKGDTESDSPTYGEGGGGGFSGWRLGGWQRGEGRWRVGGDGSQKVEGEPLAVYVREIHGSFLRV